MTENRWTPPDAGPAGSSRGQPSPRGGRLLALGVLFTIAVASVAGGVLLDRYVLLPRIFGFRGMGEGGMRSRTGPPPGGRGRGGSDRGGGRQAFHERLAEELSLTPSQRSRMDSLMDRQERALRAAHEAVQPRIDSIVGDTRTKLDALLTAEQRQKLDSLRARGAFGAPDGRGRRRGPGPDAFGPAGGPGSSGKPPRF
jgi:Spy/CpxP family protein refolding chaperone